MLDYIQRLHRNNQMAHYPRLDCVDMVALARNHHREERNLSHFFDTRKRIVDAKSHPHILCGDMSISYASSCTPDHSCCVVACRNKVLQYLGVHHPYNTLWGKDHQKMDV